MKLNKIIKAAALELLFFKKKENLGAVIACVVLVGFIGFLLGANYLSQKELQASALQQLRQKTEKRATAVGYFYKDRQQDLKNLGESKVLTAFFENKALGMSIQYGLGASLLAVSQQFDRLVQKKLSVPSRSISG